MRPLVGELRSYLPRSGWACVPQLLKPKCFGACMTWPGSLCAPTQDGTWCSEEPACRHGAPTQRTRDWTNRRSTLRAEPTSGPGCGAGAPLVCTGNRCRAPENQLEWQESQQCLLVVLPTFSSAQSCPTLCDPMDCSTPGLPVHRQPCPLSRWCHPTISSSVIPFNLSQHQGLFKWVSSSHEVAKVLEF